MAQRAGGCARLLPVAAIVMGLWTSSAGAIAPPPDDPPPSSPVCVGAFGDVNASGATNVTDVQCLILAALEALGSDTPIAPECLVGGLEESDLNCSGVPDVSDVILTIYAALDIPLSAEVDADANGCPDTCDLPPGQCACQGEIPVCAGESCPLNCSAGFAKDANGCVTCECEAEEDLCEGLPVIGEDCLGEECNETFGGACDPKTGVVSMADKGCGGFCDGSSWCDNAECPDPMCYEPSSPISQMNCGEEADLCDNGVCDPGETCVTCGIDCGACPALTTECCLCEVEPQCCTNTSNPMQATYWGPECTAAAEACDTVPPVLNCPATAIVPGDADCVGLPPEASAYDNCSPQVGIRAITEDVVGEGPHNIVYIATDVAGNESLCQTTLTVSGCPCDDCLPPPSDILARWPLDEPAGNTFEDIVGGRDGVALANPLPVTGVVGGARSFDGDDAIDVPYFPFPDPAGSFTIELWHYWEQAQYVAGQAIVAKDDVFWLMAYDGFGYHIHLGPGFMAYKSYWDNIPKTWTHLAVTVDQGNGTAPVPDGIRFYANGQQVGSAVTALQIFNLNVTDVLRIGGRWGAYYPNGYPLAWNTGAVDDLTIYTRALSASEINDIYQAGCSGKCYDGPQWTAADYGTAPPLCDPDTLAPTISYCGVTQNFTGCEVPDEPPGLQVTDDCDEAPVANVTGPTVVTTIDSKDGPSLIAPPGLFSYGVEGTDASGNQTNCTMYVQFTDASPEITCPLPLSIDLGSACTGTPPLASATDSCDGAPPEVEMSPSVLTPGLITITYTATNQANKSASCTTQYQVVSDSPCPAECTEKLCEE